MTIPRTWLRGPVTAGMIRDFCAASLDFNEIHLSREAALAAGLEDGPIVHGMMLYGIVEICLDEVDGYQLGRLSLQFVKPLLVNSSFQIEARLVKDNGKMMFLRLVVKNAVGKPIAIGEALLQRLSSDR